MRKGKGMSSKEIAQKSRETRIAESVETVISRFEDPFLMKNRVIAFNKSIMRIADELSDSAFRSVFQQEFRILRDPKSRDIIEQLLETMPIPLIEISPQASELGRTFDQEAVRIAQGDLDSSARDTSLVNKLHLTLLREHDRLVQIAHDTKTSYFQKHVTFSVLREATTEYYRSERARKHESFRQLRLSAIVMNGFWELLLSHRRSERVTKVVYQQKIDDLVFYSARDALDQNLLQKFAQEVFVLYASKLSQEQRGAGFDVDPVECATAVFALGLFRGSKKRDEHTCFDGENKRINWNGINTGSGAIPQAIDYARSMKGQREGIVCALLQIAWRDYDIKRKFGKIEDGDLLGARRQIFFSIAVLMICYCYYVGKHALQFMEGAEEASFNIVTIYDMLVAGGFPEKLDIGFEINGSNGLPRMKRLADDEIRLLLTEQQKILIASGKLRDESKDTHDEY